MGPVNSVIHYLDVNHGDAVYLAPVQLTRQQQAPGAGGTAGSLHAAVMQNFRSACQIIHGYEIFQYGFETGSQLY